MLGNVLFADMVSYGAEMSAKAFYMKEFGSAMGSARVGICHATDLALDSCQ